MSRFHSERPGITEELLSRCTAVAGGASVTPYQWCADGLGDGPRGRNGRLVADVASGSAPMADLVPNVICFDSSRAEAAEARSRRSVSYGLSAVDALPVADNTFDSAVVSMALQIIQPFRQCLLEVGRVVAPGGRLAAIVPTTWPLSPTDLLTYERIQFSLRHLLTYPNDRLLRRRKLSPVAAGAGLDLVSRERLSFGFPLRDRSDAHLLVRSLYLPRLADQTRLGRAVDILASRIGTTIGIPIARLVFDKLQPTAAV